MQRARFAGGAQKGPGASASTATVGALVVPVPEADPVLDRERLRLDPSRRQDMPAHVTVVVPFLPGALVDDASAATLAGIFAGFEPFGYRLAGPAWFGTRVLYLAPEPAEPFRRLTAAVVACFPDHPPYGGAFDRVVPHVTVGESGRWRRRRAAMRRAGARLRQLAPIAATATDVWLADFEPGEDRWRWVRRFPLGGGSA